MDFEKRAEAERARVVAYLEEHRLETVLQDAVDLVVREQPKDPLQLISQLLSSQSLAAKGGILEVQAREILNSQGLPTIEVSIFTILGEFTAQGPSHTAATRVVGEKSCRYDVANPLRYQGRGLSEAVKFVQETLGPALVGLQPLDQLKVDDVLSQKGGELGGEGLIALSMAVCKAGAKQAGLPVYKYIARIAGLESDTLVLPVPIFSLINGGNYSTSRLFVQDVAVLPSDATSFEHALELCSTFKNIVGKVLKERGHAWESMGLAGGAAPPIENFNEAMEILMEAYNQFEHKERLRFYVDVSASQFKAEEGGNKSIEREKGEIGPVSYDLDTFNKDSRGNFIESEDLVDLYKEWIKKYPRIISLQDPFDRHDIHSYIRLKEIVAQLEEEAGPDQKRPPVGGDPGCKLQIVGNCIFADEKEISLGIEEHAANALYLDLAKARTISDAIHHAELARRANWGVVVGTRGADTEETFIAEFSVGIRSCQLRVGGMAQSQHLAKINQLLRITAAQERPPYVKGEFRRRVSA